MSPVITFGGLLGEATEGRIVSTKIGSGQALSCSEASVCAFVSLFLLVFEESAHSMTNPPQSRLPPKVMAVESMGEPFEQEKMHS